MKNKIITICLVVIFIVLLILINNVLKKQSSVEENNNNEEVKSVEILEVTTESFEKEVLESDKKVLIDFYADWCNPCKMLAPTIDEIASENENIKIVRINIDNEADLAVRYGIVSIPTLVVIQDGEEKGRMVGVVSKFQINNMIQK